MRLPRASGILLHPTSLPGPRGIGEIGREARSFVDFLAQTGQRWWQMLPVGPTGYGNSPYQSHSSFAGNRLLIDPEFPIEQGWLIPEECPDAADSDPDKVDFDAVALAKDHWLEAAFGRFDAQSSNPARDEFLEVNRVWLEDYALYSAIKDSREGRPWHQWPAPLAAREPKALRESRAELARRVRYHEFVQFLFASEWKRLRAYCQEKGVMLIGDVPIFVAHDAADVWANPELFILDEHGMPTVVAGVPPDYFSETGQLWGNPLYHWDVHAASDYAWWTNRLRFLLRRVDLVRIDHFRGFEAYWEIPSGATTAAPGRWAQGPGASFFETLRRTLGSLPLIAEDLGMITPSVEILRDQFDLPGMRVLQFGFGPDVGSEKHLPHRYSPHCVAYTGTHDNDTTAGWFTSTDVATTQSAAEIEAERAFARRYLGCGGDAIHWAMIKLAHASVADTAIAPMQDVLGQGGQARMNLPGRAAGNWGWRMRAGDLDPRDRDRLAELTAVYSRWNGPVPPAIDPHHRPAPPTNPGSPEPA